MRASEDSGSHAGCSICCACCVTPDYNHTTHTQHCLLVVGNGAALSASEPWKAFITHAKHCRCATLLDANQPPNLLARPPQAPAEYYHDADREKRAQALAAVSREREASRAARSIPQDPRLARSRKQMRQVDREEGEILSDDSDDDVVVQPRSGEQGRQGMGDGGREKRKEAPPGARAEDSHVERQQGGGDASRGASNKKLRLASGHANARGVVTLLSSSDEDAQDCGKRPPSDSRESAVGASKRARGTGASAAGVEADAGKQLFCASCQTHFWFSEEERQRLLDMDVTETPSRCRPWYFGTRA